MLVVVVVVLLLALGLIVMVSCVLTVCIGMYLNVFVDEYIFCGFYVCIAMYVVSSNAVGSGSSSSSIATVSIMTNSNGRHI